MDDLELLHDDHALLSSQIVHVIALIKSLEGGQSSAVALVSEVLRQLEILRQQLHEHFAFEEEEAFSRLSDQHPAYKERLQHLIEQHDQILAAFEELRSIPWAQSQGVSAPDAAARCYRFESAFTEHAAAETELFREISGLTQ